MASMQYNELRKVCLPSYRKGCWAKHKNNEDMIRTEITRSLGGLPQTIQMVVWPSEPGVLCMLHAQTSSVDKQRFVVCPEIGTVFVEHGGSVLLPLDYTAECVRLAFGEHYKVRPMAEYAAARREYAQGLCAAACALQGVLPHAGAMLAPWMRPAWF